MLGLAKHSKSSSCHLTQPNRIIVLRLSIKPNNPIVNRIRIGLVKGNICPALIPTYEEGQLSKVDVRIVHKEIIFLALIEGYPILRQGHMGSIAKYPDLYEVKSKIINHDLNETLFLAKECTGHNENYICLIDSDRIQKIDLIKESVSVVGGGDIRHDIACMLGLTWM